MNLRAMLHSRVLLAVGIAVSVVVPALTLPRLPQVSLWPVLLGLAPWVVGKYVLCPLRWRVLTPPGRSRTWHLRAYAEAELLGLLTPGHVGADLWRLRRLTRTGLGRGDALLSVGTDRFVGAIGLALFVGFAGTALPLRMLVVAVAVGVVAVGVALAVRQVPTRAASRWTPASAAAAAPGTRALRGLPAHHRRAAAGHRCRHGSRGRPLGGPRCVRREPARGCGAGTERRESP